MFYETKWSQTNLTPLFTYMLASRGAVATFTRLLFYALYFQFCTSQVMLPQVLTV